MTRLFRSPFVIRLFNWEYWPFWAVQWPLFLYWLWLALRARALFFFSASNPSIPTGGMMGESKFDVLELIPQPFKPTSIRLSPRLNAADVMSKLTEAGLALPVIFKPDMGERGWMVKRINTEADVQQYLTQIKISFIAQELLTLPLEFGVFYWRLPGTERGTVNSITGKEFLSVTGDGRHTLAELIRANPRALLQWDKLMARLGDKMNSIPAAGNLVELVSIGNHCLGTKFINANHLITPQLTDSFDRMSKQINGFYFGRFDLRCASVEDLQAGRIKIMELNGCGAEPAHIYHPGASLWAAWRTLFRHWHTLYRVSVANHRLGVPYLSLAEGKKIYQRFKAAQA